jgi:hypothetical protein
MFPTAQAFVAEVTATDDSRSGIPAGTAGTGICCQRPQVSRRVAQGIVGALHAADAALRSPGCDGWPIALTRGRPLMPKGDTAPSATVWAGPS